MLDLLLLSSFSGANYNLGFGELVGEKKKEVLIDYNLGDNNNNNNNGSFVLLKDIPIKLEFVIMSCVSGTLVGSSERPPLFVRKIVYTRQSQRRPHPHVY